MRKVVFPGWVGKFLISGGRGKPVTGKIPGIPPTDMTLFEVTHCTCEAATKM